MARGELHTKDQDAQEQADADDLQEQFDALGLVPDAPVRLDRDPVFYLWPDNQRAWNFFHACCTQWRHGPRGETGLVYEGVETLMGVLRIPLRRRQRLWALLRVAELGFLEGRREKREEEDQREREEQAALRSRRRV